MLLLGTITPINPAKESDISGLRGVLLDLDLLMGANNGNGAYPSTAVEHGWKVCIDTCNGAALYFALNGQRYMDNVLKVLQPAMLPLLTTIGLRLWRRGDVAHALVPKNITNAAVGDWDEEIKHFLETPVE